MEEQLTALKTGEKNVSRGETFAILSVALEARLDATYTTSHQKPQCNHTYQKQCQQLPVATDTVAGEKKRPVQPAHMHMHRHLTFQKEDTLFAGISQEFCG